MIKYKLFHIVTLICLGLSFARNSLSSEEKSSTNSFCWNCNKYSSEFQGGELIIYSNSSETEDGDDFYEFIDLISEEIEFVVNHKFFKLLPPLPYSEYGFFLDYQNSVGGGIYDPKLKTEKRGPILTLDPNALGIDNERQRLFAHEFTHVVHYHFRPHESLWLKEAIAQIVQFYITNNFSLSYKTAFRYPDTSLNASINHLDRNYILSRDAQYGHVLQYIFYLQRVCGGPGLIKDLMVNPSQLTDIQFVDFILKKNKSLNRKQVCSSFEESFIAFQKARFFPDYYKEESYLQVAPSKAQIFPVRKKTMPPYSAQAYQNLDGKCFSKNRTYIMESVYCLEIRLE